MNQISDPVADTERGLVSETDGLYTLLIRRTYDASPEELWGALTDPDRLARWFLPVEERSELAMRAAFSLLSPSSRSFS